MTNTTLDNWILERIDPSRRMTNLSRDVLLQYQIQKIQEIVDYARSRSFFYRRHLEGISGKNIQSPRELATVPFTTADDLRENGLHFLCVSLDDIERVTTLETSGTTEKPKRVYFTRDDLESTIDFFHHGMRMFVQPGSRVLVLLPGVERENSAADLLKKGLGRLGSAGIPYGAVKNPEEVLNAAGQHNVDGLVGIPTEIFALARCDMKVGVLRGRLKQVILCSDYVPEAIVREVNNVWACPVVSHYGTTEMGLGGAVECRYRSGYHVREADLYLEIVDPESGELLPEGEYGEVVFTTLTRKGMPLIRYRTGDLSRFLPGFCQCGTTLRRLEKIERRVRQTICLGNGLDFTIGDLDEALFPVPGFLNYEADVCTQADTTILQLSVYPGPGKTENLSERIKQAVWTIPSIAQAIKAGRLVLEDVRFRSGNGLKGGLEKRTITVHKHFMEEGSSPIIKKVALL